MNELLERPSGVADGDAMAHYGEGVRRRLTAFFARPGDRLPLREREEMKAWASRTTCSTRFQLGRASSRTPTQPRTPT